MKNRIKLMSENDNSTVVVEYNAVKNNKKSYQSEAELELDFIKNLSEQGYQYLDIQTSDELINNLRNNIEKLNNIKLSDVEWEKVFTDYISNQNDGIVEKTKKIQENSIYPLERDNNELVNIMLIDKNNIYRNNLQVIHQYENNAGKYDNRYDVTLLINGLPLVHIELKRRGVNLREAFNQIERYQRDSFWSDCGLYNYVQIFIISNGTRTKYYSNTTRFTHIKDNMVKKSNSYEFTSYWADQNNKNILDLIDFTKTFLSKRTLLNIITKYCVLTVDNDLLVMRPYQIVATEKIINKIEMSHNYSLFGSVDAGGYIWHTTGSGKTLTSFKTSQLATSLPYIKKVLFVVDRKDLDYQTMKEYNKFKEGAANSNVSTKVLEQQLLDSNTKIIITTIQKLDNFIKKNENNDIYKEEIVFIFDECHRSQFGQMHNNIIKKFKKYYIFGFTGTPIFKENSKTINGIQTTTKQIFGEKLHTYTIVDAISDKNVLPFRYEYVGRVDISDDMKDEKVYGIDIEKAYNNPKRIKAIVDYIINSYSSKTKTSESYVYLTLDNIKDVANSKSKMEVKTKKNLNGFNSIFAVSSISSAKKYYEEFKKHIDSNLKIALIYSYGVNDDDLNGMVDENPEDTLNLDKADRDFLDYAIKDYNELFNTNYDTSSEGFQSYYKDVSLRMKNREIDILIVVNMFLTGFDAKTLNTLWVDKNLIHHGLIQAFSRTNRILNSVKTFGNIVSFRNLETNLNNALALFGDKNAAGIVLMKSYKDYYYGYQENSKNVEGYKDLIEKLLTNYPLDKEIIGEKNKKEFIKLYGTILKLINILSTFDEFNGNKIIEDRDLQDYHSIYIDLYEEFKNIKNSDKIDISEDIVFEMELIKSIEVNIDYILLLVEKYHQSHMQNKELLISIDKAIMSSPDLRDKRELILNFINTLSVESTNIHDDFEMYINEKKLEDLNSIIKEENLDSAKTIDYIEKSFLSGNIDSNGTNISELLPPISMFTQDKERLTKKNIVIEKLTKFFEKYFTLSNN